jgi:hypothetical protein
MSAKEKPKLQRWQVVIFKIAEIYDLTIEAESRLGADNKVREMIRQGEIEPGELEGREFFSLVTGPIGEEQTPETDAFIEPKKRTDN